ncbi:MAG TPA: glycosyltransferase family 9 protein [Thermomicrobiales bacterium]|nr:glycosyltransferase family 9 protein [Thermomicrobiales bacterium]
MTTLAHMIRDAGLVVAAGVSPRATSAGDTVLVMQPDHLGDILLSQPAVRLLRQQLPDVRLVAVVGSWSSDIARMAWPVDDIVTVEFPGFTRAATRDPSAPYRKLKSAARSLAPLNAGIAIVLRPDAWWAAWLGSLVASEVITSDDPRASRFATRQALLVDDEHAALRAARIVAEWVGGELPSPVTAPLSIPPCKSARDGTTSLLRAASIDSSYVVIHPGSGAAVKLWPESRWRQVIDALRNQGVSVVVTGSDGERDLCDRITSGVDAVSLAGQTNIAGLLEIMRGATLAIGADSGPMHLAVAAGTPTIHLFGPSDPCRYGPWGDPVRHRIISAGWRCPRCGDLSPGRPAGCGCMLAITPEAVIATIDSLLSTHATG